MTPLLTLDALPAARRDARWREAVSETFVRLDCRIDARGPAHGRLESGAHGELRVARVTSCPQRVERSRDDARRADGEWMLASVQLAGRTVVRQGDEQAVLGPGDIAFYDTARPYTLLLPDDFDQVVLYLPRATVEAATPDGLRRTAVRLAATEPCARSLHALAASLLELDTRSRAGTIAVELMMLALDTLDSRISRSGSNVGDAGGRGSQALYRRALGLISSRFADARFSPGTLARELGVSPRRLQEVFRERGETATARLRNMRLDFANEWLSSPTGRREAVARVGERAGFGDAANFSRRFRHRFGYPPSEARRRGGG